MIHYRLLKPGEEQALCDMIISVFDVYIRPWYTPQGVDSFLRYVNPAAQAQRLQYGHHVTVAEADGQIVGMVEYRNFHIHLLFVAVTHQRRGIGRALVDQAVQAQQQRYGGFLPYVTVSASLNAVDAYMRWGFTPTGHEHDDGGIRYIPMMLTLHEDEQAEAEGQGPASGT